MVNEGEVIQKIRAGQKNAFTQLVEKHKVHITATILGMTGDYEAAQDVGQEVFIRFYKNIHQFEGKSTLKTYLTRIAINLSLNHLNKRKRQNNVVIFPEKIKEFYQENLEHSKKELREIINKALQHLDEKHRTILVLRMIQQYSTKETAELLNIPLGTVLSRLNNAQKKMKEIILEKYPEIIGDF